jgi:hypothetical protein
MIIVPSVIHLALSCIVEIQVSKAGQQTPDVTQSVLVDSYADATVLPITALQSIY